MCCIRISRRYVSSCFCGVILIQQTHIVFGERPPQCYHRQTHRKRGEVLQKGARRIFNLNLLFSFVWLPYFAVFFFLLSRASSISIIMRWEICGTRYRSYQTEVMPHLTPRRDYTINTIQCVQKMLIAVKEGNSFSRNIAFNLVCSLCTVDTAIRKSTDMYTAFVWDSLNVHLYDSIKKIFH